MTRYLIRRLLWAGALFVEVTAVTYVIFFIVFGGVTLWLAQAIPIGILSALRPRTVLDRLAMIFVLVGVSAHPV
jgi:ABC-type dipeptide/oligopeptide/nickel transport system permease component